MNRFVRVVVRASRSHTVGSYSRRTSAINGTAPVLGARNVTVRYFSEKGKKDDEITKELDDATVQRQFDTIVGRFDALLGSFNEERNAYDIHQDLRTKNPDFSWLSAWGLTSDLLNPLLKKYKGAFDVAEFCDGVRLAFPVINNAVAVTINATAEPEKYADQKAMVEEQTQLLHDTTTEAFRKNLHVIIREQKLLRQMGMKWNITAAKKELTRVEPYRVKLRVVKANDTNEDDDDVLASGGTAVLSASEQLVPPKLHLPRPTPTSREIEQHKEDLQRYKDGAVIATVEVIMSIVEKADFQPIVLEKPSGNAQLDEMKREALKELQLVKITRMEMWIFESCISGHVPQSWILTEIVRQ